MIHKISRKRNKFLSQLVVVFLVFVFFMAPVVPAFAATVQAQQSAPTVTNYTYDPSGQRITVSNGTTTTVYPTKNYNTDGTNVTKHVFANGANTATIQGTGADAKIYYNHTDSLNSSSVMTDSAGAIAETIDYYPFGGIRIDNKTGTFNEQRKYIGQDFDQDTGLNYLNTRYYNSNISRFISQDPVFSAVGDNNQIKKITGKSQQEILADPQSLNSYSYANNNPITKSDPSGQCPICVIGIGMLAMYAPQITNFAQSLLTPMGQLGINQATEDSKQGHYSWAVFGFATAGEVPGRNINNLSKLETLPLRKHAIEGFANLANITGKNSQEILKEISKKGEAFIDFAHEGNINIYIQRGKESITRITTDPEITRIISAGTNQVKDLVKWTDNGRLTPLNESGNLTKFIKDTINSLKK